jgi:hypothetical protein
VREAPSVNNRRLRLGLLVAGVLLWKSLFFVALWWWLCGGWTPARVERILADLPNGSTPAEVEAFLRSRGMPFEKLHSPEGRGAGWIEIEGANVDPFYNGEIQIHFDFDQNGRLIGHRLAVDVCSL